MSDLSDLAAKIDEMTLDELVAAASADGLPVAGGDHDTRQGWAKRLNMDIKSQVFINLWKMLEDAKLIEPRQGRVKRGEHHVKRVLYYSPSLAKKAGRAER